MRGSRRRLILAATVVLVGCVALASCGASSQPAPPVTRPSEVTSSAASPVPSPAPTLSFGVPVRLVIPSIKVDAAVEEAGKDEKGFVADPKDSWHVVWYNGSILPGLSGNAYFSGHFDWYAEPSLGRPHGPRVFANLGSVRNGDEIWVFEENGSRLLFRVDTVDPKVPHDASTEEWLVREGPPTLTLTTCAGDWDTSAATYKFRLVVHATLIGH